MKYVEEGKRIGNSNRNIVTFSSHCHISFKVKVALKIKYTGLARHFEQTDFKTSRRGRNSWETFRPLRGFIGLSRQIEWWVLGRFWKGKEAVWRDYRWRWSKSNYNYRPSWSVYDYSRNCQTQFLLCNFCTLGVSRFVIPFRYQCMHFVKFLKVYWSALRRETQSCDEILTSVTLQMCWYTLSECFSASAQGLRHHRDRAKT